CVQARDFPWTF
nr:immunoglobulin light chain junction region [Macaca mulatta]